MPGTTPQQAEEAFRRARGLLTADKLESWLAVWQVEPDDFRRWTDDVAAGTATATDWCTVLCSGRYDATVAEVLTAAAAACELDGNPLDPDLFEPAGWTERLLATRTTPALLEAAVADHRLDWTQLAILTAVAASRPVAEELRHQVLVDGADLATAAGRAHCPTQEVASPLAALSPATLQSALAGARPGEVVGPLPVGTSWVLLQVASRTEPALDDPATRALAEATVHRDVIARAVARHVVA